MTSPPTIISADGQRIAVRRTGSGDPVVALHGSGGGLHSFAGVAERMADRCELWSVARLGRAGNSFEAEVADVLAVLEAAGRPAHLLGASTGAILALHTALADPDSVRSLALFEPPLFACGPALVPVLERYRALLSRDELGEAAVLYASEVARVPRPLVELLMAARAEHPPDVEEERRAALATLHDFEALTGDGGDIARWSALELPTLLLQGTETWEPVPTSVNALAEALPHAKRVALEGQSHFAFNTAPDLVAGALLEFYAGLG
jgi:pimeloyl-ACP methyl ester carboxylesterase